MPQRGIPLRRFGSDEAGWVSAWSLFMIMTFLMMGGLAVDYTQGVMTRAKLQAVSDSAALAASMELPDQTKATEEGIAIASLHFGASEGNPIVAGDFIYGNWDASLGRLVVGATPTNAVQVVANRTGGRSNAMPTFLLQLVGFDSLDVVSSSVAVTEQGFASNCTNGGFFSNAKVNSGSNNDYYEGFCLYGRQGVKIGSDNTFEDSVRIIMENKSDFQKSGNNTIPDGVLIENTYTLSLLDMVTPVINSMKSESLAYMPSYITKTEKVSKLEPENASDLDEGTLYVVDDVADLSKVSYVKNIAVVANKEVKIGSNQTIYNVVFATQDKILIGSNNAMEHPNACTNGAYSIYMFSGSNIEFGSNNDLTGVQMAAKDMLKLGSDVKGFKDVYAEVENEIEYGSADSFAGCPGGLSAEIGPGPIKTGGGTGLRVHALVR